MTYRHALTLGKFYPPHVGHLHLIEEACGASDVTTVLVIASRRESLPLDVRVRILRSALASGGVSNVRVIGVFEDTPVDFGSEAAWVAHLAVDRAALASAEGRSTTPGAADLYGSPVDAVFTSEDYGKELASRLGARHVEVDLARVRVPVRGREIRRALSAPSGDQGSPVELARRVAWEQLPPAGRAVLTRRIVLVGAESTGKTTLARSLATHFATVWVPEYGRFYTERRTAGTGAEGMAEKPWSDGEFALICRQQQFDEDALAASAGPVLVCDTDALATSVWQARYTGHTSAGVLAAAGSRTYTAYLLTSPTGVPWEADGIRDGELERAGMHEEFFARLRERTAVTGEPWLLLEGTPAQRLAAAVRFLEPLLPLTFTSSFDSAMMEG